MKVKSLTAIATGMYCLIILSSPAKAQVAAGYEIAKWYNFKKAAVTYTFDDNTSKQLSVAVPLFDLYNYDVTLFTVTDWVTTLPSWTGLQTASNNGHEIASHTVSHPNLSSSDIPTQTTELQNSQSAINSNISNASCLTIAYPYCVPGDLSTIQSYYIAGRGCSGSIEPATPSDFYNISSIIAGTEGPVQNATDFNNKVNSAKTSEGWCVFLLHGIDDDGGYSPIASSEISAHLSYMNTNNNDLWVGTFLNVVKYIKERNAVSLVETPVNSDSVQITVSDGLDNTIYNAPVTVRRIIPASWPNARVYVDGVQIPYKNEMIGSDYYIIFNVVPNEGDVRIASSNDPLILSAGSVASKHNVNVTIKPNPFLNDLSIEVKGVFQYYIYSKTGSLIEKGSGKDIGTAGANLEAGDYLIKIEQKNKLIHNSKIIKR